MIQNPHTYFSDFHVSQEFDSNFWRRRVYQVVDLKIVKDGVALIERIRTLYAPRWWGAT
jgi:hypothetical protein